MAILPSVRSGYVLLTMPSGNVAKIPLDTEDPFDLDEAKQFEAIAQHRGHTNILALLHGLRRQGLGRTQAVDVVCTYLDLLKQDDE